MSDGLISLLGIAHPWMCDEFRHMNRRFYAAMFDDATLVALRHLDIEDRRSDLGWADVKSETEYRSETKCGVILRVRSHVTKIGTSSLTLAHTMTDVDNGNIVAVEKCISVRFDLEKRISHVLSKSIIDMSNSIMHIES